MPTLQPPADPTLLSDVVIDVVKNERMVTSYKKKAGEGIYGLRAGQFETTRVISVPFSGGSIDIPAQAKVTIYVDPKEWDIAKINGDEAKKITEANAPSRSRAIQAKKKPRTPPKKSIASVPRVACFSYDQDNAMHEVILLEDGRILQRPPVRIQIRPSWEK